MRYSAAVAVLLVAGCAAPPQSNDAPAAPRSVSSKSLLPGTIGVLVAPADGGLRVEALAQDGPAARAGLQVGDVIVRCANAPVTTPREFNQRVLDTRPGERLRLDVRRAANAQPVRLDVSVAQLRTALRP